MPARKTKGKTAVDTSPKVAAEELAAAENATAAATVEIAAGAADATRGEDEAASAVAFSALGDAAARRGALESAEGAATLSLADQVAAGGELSAALSSDEFRRGMELAGIAGQVQVVAELLGGIAQPTLARFWAARATSCASWRSKRSAGPPRELSSPTARSTSPVSSRRWDSPR